MKKQVLEILQKQHDIYINCFRETQNDEFLHKSRAIWDALERVKQLPDDDCDDEYWCHELDDDDWDDETDFY